MIVRFLDRHFRSPHKALAADHPPHIPVAESLHALEPRHMFDAAGVATGAEAAVDAVAQEQAEQAVVNHLNDSGAADAGQGNDASPTDNADANDQLLEALATHQPATGRREIVFIDTSVEGYQKLIAGIDPSAEVVLLDSTRDGVEQIAEVLSGRSGIDAIHIVSHGSQAELRLGTARLTLDSMTGQYVDELAVLGQALTDEADLLVYGCDFGQSQLGQEAATTLAKITGADVAASEDATGHATLGGDWDLELRVGRVDTTTALTAEEQANYMGLLATEYVRDEFNFDTYDGNNGSGTWNGDWQELGDGGSGAGSGFVSVSEGQLTFVGSGTAEVYRAVDLSQAGSATLSLDYSSSGLLALGQVTLEISSDGGGSWTVLETYDGLLLSGGAGTSTFDISAWATADTQIRLNGSLVSVLGAYTFDNIEILYDVNNAPVNTVPGAQTVAEDTPLALGGISVNDADGNLSTVALAVGNGTLTVTLQGGASISAGANGSAALTLSGSQADVNATLATLSYQGSLNYNGADTLTVTSTDINSASDTDTVALTVTAVNDAPVATADSGTAAEGASTAIDLAANDTDADNALDLTSIQIVSGPANGSAVVQGPGVSS